MASDPSDETPKKKILGVRYEPQISAGTILLMLGYIGSVGLFWVNQEHRITQLEDRQTSLEKMIDGRVQARLALDTIVAGDLLKIHDQLGDISLRVYHLEITTATSKK